MRRTGLLPALVPMALLLMATPVRAEEPAPTAPPAFSPPMTWLARGTAQLQALDKVNARGTQFLVKVGQSATFGSLIITVKGCVVRAPDQPADAAAWLEIKDLKPNAPGFTGWMLRSDPSLSMLAHPIYDIRVTGCTG